LIPFVPACIKAISANFGEFWAIFGEQKMALPVAEMKNRDHFYKLVGKFTFYWNIIF